MFPVDSVAIADLAYGLPSDTKHDARAGPAHGRGPAHGSSHAAQNDPDAAEDSETGEPGEPSKAKLMVILFMLFILVSSNIFVDSVVASFSGAVIGRTPTVWGCMLQAIFLVLLYIISSKLVELEYI